MEDKKLVTIELALEELTVGNLVSEVRRVVGYARSKGAPDDAFVRVRLHQFFEPSSFSGPMPHEAIFQWDEAEKGEDR